MMSHTDCQMFNNSLVSVVLSNSKTPQPPTEFSNNIKELISMMKKYYVPKHVASAIIECILRFLDAQVFNTLLKRSELYTSGSGFQIKMIISNVENSYSKAIGAEKHLAGIIQ